VVLVSKRGGLVGVCGSSSTRTRTTTPPSCGVLSAKKVRGNGDNDDEEDDDNESQTPAPPMDLPADEISAGYTREELQQLTVAQLKQQLRLRGWRVSGRRKAELVDRLHAGLLAGADVVGGVRGESNSGDDENGARDDDDNNNKNDGTVFLSAEQAAARVRQARELAAKNSQELVDVTAYLDKEDRGKQVKTAGATATAAATANSEDDVSKEEAATTEIWGAEARLGLSDDDNRPIVDSLSRTVMEFKGSNQTYVPARVIATRDALRPYLEGRAAANRTRRPEDELRDIQLRRERQAARPIRQEDVEGLDEGDETGIFANVLNREVSDWGKYTATGAQLSAQEVQGVLLLTDVYGAFSEDTTALAEKIAFECQPVVVMIPDLFRGQPWTGPTDQVNEEGQTYEEWRAIHSDLRVSVDIRAAAACLRETYGVSSVVVFGMCYGGGRALEAAAGWFESVHDIDGRTIGPPPVDPSVAVAWYPTRYKAENLFGPHRKGVRRDQTFADGSKRRMAVMGVFAEKDSIPGATVEDAATLKKLLEEDERVVDHMVKVFPGQDHGFAHIGLSQRQKSLDDSGEGDDMERFVDEEFGGAGRLSIADGDAEVACLLSTAFMETYSRVFLPTVGPPISLDEQEQEWGRELNMKDLESTSQRDVRSEIKDAIENFVEEPLQSGPRIDPTDTSQEEELMKLLRSMEDPNRDGPFKIEDDDDLPTIYAKLTSSDENFQIF